MATPSLALENAYQWCEGIARSHYENFPVASYLLPVKLRRPIAVIYAFARIADDISDEGNDSDEERLEKLNQLWQALEAIEQGQDYLIDSPLFFALKEIIQTHSLPIDLFFDLLRAFKQDIVKKEYETAQALLHYCHYSANPVGRLILHLSRQATPQNCQDSDAICTALQLINFLQDLNADLRLRHRYYIPQDEMEHCGVTKEELLSQSNTLAVQQLIHQQWQRANQLLQTGKPLAGRIPGLLGLELRLIVSAGEQILKALKKRKNPYERPVLKTWHWPSVFFNALVFSK